MSRSDPLARGLGLFSLGLGLAQVVVPGRVSELIGGDTSGNSITAMRAIGLRELSAAAPLLTRPSWIWTATRVMGDAMDLTVLGAAAVTGRLRRDRATAALLAVAGVAAIDAIATVRMNREAGGRDPSGGEIRKSVTVDATPDELYSYWRDLERLPQFMTHLEEVRELDDTHSRWAAKGPAGMTAEWDAEIVEDRPGEVLSWRSIEGSKIRNSGTVRFEPAPGGRGTEVHVSMEYAPPLGTVGNLVAKLFGEEPSQQISNDLRRFKSLIETGTYAESDATAGGRQMRQRPARPVESVPERESAGVPVFDRESRDSTSGSMPWTTVPSRPFADRAPAPADR